MRGQIEWGLHRRGVRSGNGLGPGCRWNKRVGYLAQVDPHGILRRSRRQPGVNNSAEEANEDAELEKLHSLAFDAYVDSDLVSG